MFHVEHRVATQPLTATREAYCRGAEAQRHKAGVCEFFPWRFASLGKSGRLSPVGTFAISHAAQARGSTDVKQRAPAGRLTGAIAPPGLRINERTVHGLAPVANRRSPYRAQQPARIWPRTQSREEEKKVVASRAMCLYARPGR